MKVKGKHRELLIELLIYYMNKDSHNHIQFGNFINEEDPTGRFWISAYIDSYEDRYLNWGYNKTLSIKRSIVVS
jgi:hypothetical protein